MKHVAINFHFVREQVECKQLEVAHLHAYDEVADLLTKPFPRAHFGNHFSKLGVITLKIEVLRRSRKELQELRVFPSDPFSRGPNVSLREQGLVAVSVGCHKLKSVLYFCCQMTNDALVTIARNRPNMIQFRLCIFEPQTPDYLTLEPLDADLGGHYRVFECIGFHAKKLEVISLAFVGDSNLGLHYVLFGWESLRKLEIGDCPFVNFDTCKLLAQKLPGLNVEVIDERGHPDMRPESCPVEKLYTYKTVSRRRFDTRGFVWIIDENGVVMYFWSCR
ncbi:hypothetical protein H5410_030268 [Solanum commersonii]|uniref:Uncharacterized protein n=1 Tax=Solanum commersonii TaxID=4109 RepID=A0A9J5YF84_SOLCO|nr:hypothetical protein H5410_030268 [Solanum commersonii]